jgi:hypothetical protein
MWSTIGAGSCFDAAISFFLHKSQRFESVFDLLLGQTRLVADGLKHVHVVQLFHFFDGCFFRLDIISALDNACCQQQRSQTRAESSCLLDFVPEMALIQYRGGVFTSFAESEDQSKDGEWTKAPFVKAKLSIPSF